MAILNNINNTTFLSLALQQDIKTTIGSAFTAGLEGLSDNIGKLTTSLDSISSTGFLSSGLVNSSQSSLKYWISGNASDPSQGYFEALGSGLPVYDASTKNFNQPKTGFNLTQMTYANPSNDNQIIQLTGKFVATPAKVTYDWGTPSLLNAQIQSVTLGDKHIKLTLSGNFIMKEIQDKSSQYWETYSQVSGSLNHLKVDVLKEGSTNSYYHLDIDFAITFKTVNQNTSFSTKINSVTITDDNGATLLSGTSLGLSINSNGEFTDAKGKVISSDLVGALTFGNDTITGTSRDDSLAGWNGMDKLTGGSGSDQFVWHSLSETGLAKKADIVTDFKSSEGDKINLSEIDSNTSLQGDQAFVFISDITKATNYNGIVWFSNGYLNISNNADSKAEYQIALTGVTQLQVSDLIL